MVGLVETVRNRVLRFALDIKDQLGEDQESVAQLPAEDAAMYDACLAGQNGNMVACDAYMRVYKRAKSQDDALEKTLKEGGAKMLAAGYSKREVVDWASGMGGVGRQLSDAAGISLRELQEGKY